MEKLSSVSFQGNKKQKEKKNVKGAVNAMLVGSLASSASMPVNRFAVHNMSKLSKGLSKDQVETVNNGAQNVLENIADLAKMVCSKRKKESKKKHLKICLSYLQTVNSH